MDNGRRQYKTCNGCAVGKLTYCYQGSGHSRRWAEEGNCSPVWEEHRIIGKNKDGINIVEDYYICDLGYEVEYVAEKDTFEIICGSNTPETVMYNPKESCFKPRTFKECVGAYKRVEDIRK